MTKLNDAIKLLTTDHAEVKALFKQYDKLVQADAPADEKKALAAHICDLLKVHTQIEEEIFYPAARAVLDEQDLVEEADVEHASAKELIGQIESGDATDDHYDAKVKVLSEYIEHHVGEEEKELFPEVRRSGLDLVDVGEQLAARKDELLSDLTADA